MFNFNMAPLLTIVWICLWKPLMSSEEQVFEGLYQWIKNVWNNRKDDISSVF